MIAAADVDWLRDERIGIAARLDSDRRARAHAIAAASHLSIVDRLGAPPAGGREREAWDKAVGLLEQHSAAFADECSRGISPDLRALHETAYTVSQRTVTNAVAQLDAALGRRNELAIDVSSYGLSL
jgi:hypothetical protein